MACASLRPRASELHIKSRPDHVGTPSAHAGDIPDHAEALAGVIMAMAVAVAVVVAVVVVVVVVVIVNDSTTITLTPCAIPQAHPGEG